MVKQEKKKKVFSGRVVSVKMLKTAVILIERVTRHPLYLKTIKIRKKLYANNSLGAREGDWVEVAETRPLSKTKRFEIVKIRQGEKK